MVENDLVAARQADRSLNPEDLSRLVSGSITYFVAYLYRSVVPLPFLPLPIPNRWLTMGHLMSISFGETSLSLEHWQMAKELERLRRERLK